MCQQRSQDKKEVHRCEHHAKSFCVWRRTTTTISTTTSSTIVKKIEHTVRDAAQRSVVSPVIARHLMKCLNAGIAAALSARCPAEGTTGIIALFVCIRDTSMIANRATE